ncbi:hypothetical protein Gotur_011290 [Gossypium turneri]
MNTANMPLTQPGVTPATNSMNFQERGFSIGNLQFPMKSIANRSVLKDSNGEIGDLRQHGGGGFTYTGDTNFQEIHASMMNTANMPLTQHGVTPVTNSMNFSEGGFLVGNPKPRMMVCILFCLI